MEFKLVNYCEFDEYASKAYSLIHNELESKNLGDITLVNEKEIADFNMMVGGSPCQDFSVAGKQEGAKWTCQDCKHEYNPLEAHYTERDKCPNCHSLNIEKTRSSLVVEWLRILREKKPNLAIYENVKNLVGKKFKETFDLFIEELHEYGYNTYWQVLNAKNYGVPQNRERVYLIIIKKGLDNGKFKFPKGFDNGIRLQNIIETEVDEKYYIKKPWHYTEEYEEKHDTNEIAQINNVNYKALRTICDVNKICRCLDTMGGGQREPKILRSDKPCKLTPLECFRLMAFEDKDFYILKENKISDSQCYKMAGNSIVTEVLYYIYKELYTAMPYLFEDIKLSSFFSGIGAFEKALKKL